MSYETSINTVTVDGSDMVQSVALTALPAQTVTFAYGSIPSGGKAVENPSLSVTTAACTIEPIQPMTYALPVGYDYTYTFKSANYAKVTGELKFSDLTEGGSQSVSLPLSVKTAWGGADDVLSPALGDGSADSPYQISTGAELAWLAQEVNAGRGTSYAAILTRDIDLGEEPWTPIGRSSSYAFRGSLDGQGHTVKGLYISADTYDQGLFGYVYNGSISNLTVEGSVTGAGGTSYTGGVGGIAGTFYSDYSATGAIENCANRASVSGGNNVGGLVGIIGGGGEKRVQGCVNYGPVSGVNNVGGLIGNFNYKCTLSNSYNRGDITASVSAAGGIAGQLNDTNAKVLNCYTTGSVTAPQNANPAIGQKSSGSVENTYYLSDLGSDALATAKTVQELTAPAFAAQLGSSFQPGSATQNGGYPILSWQSVSTPPEPGEPTLAPSAFDWRTLPGEVEDEPYGEITPVLRWDALDGVQSYDIILWAQYFVKLDTPTSGSEPVYGADGSIVDWAAADVAYEPRLEKALTLPGIAGSEDQGSLTYDLSDTLLALPDRRYYATVVPSGSPAPTLAYVEDHVIDYATPYNRLKPVTGLHWEGTQACWNAKSLPDLARDFGAEDSYTLTLYRQNEQGQFTTGASFDVAGSHTKVDCSGYFAVGGVYAFSVCATLDPALEGAGLSPSMDSLRSDDPANAGSAGLYTVPTPDAPDDDHDASWTAITTPEQWMELANLDDIYDVPGDATTSVQAQAWSQKYYLANDLDFSSLGAAWSAKTKSIGNVTHRFMGVLDGDGHKITGLTLSNYDSGLFWYIGSTGQVRDLIIEGANILVSDNAAVLAHNNFGVIAGCGVVNSNITADTGAVIGGMVSRNYGQIRDCYVERGTLLSSSSTATGHGGFVGANEEGGHIERCWTSMEVRTQSDYAGGFLGLGYGGTIRDCFALGDVSARGYSGGFVGRSVYDGNVYENCYAAGTLTVTGQEGHGFIGGNKPDSLFQYDQSSGVSNCWYNAASPADPNATGARSQAQMSDDNFAAVLNGGRENIWVRSEAENDGLPYLNGVKAPENAPETTITVTVAIAGYDKAAYTFSQLGQDLAVTLPSDGNTRVTDVMDAAQAQGLLTYSYDTTPTFGRYIHTINGRAVEPPDGWMFTVDDTLSTVSASLATVQDGSRLLWFEGTTQNRFQPPTWDELKAGALTWTDIGTVAQLLDLAQSRDPQVLSQNYHLTADLDLSGIEFSGIGSAAAPFTGRFDGQGHSIANATISGTENVGFFNVLSGASVKALTLTGLQVTGEKNVGGLVGWAQARLNVQNPTESTASLVGGCAVSGAVSGQNAVGGLVGRNGAQTDYDTALSIACSVDKCTADVAVSGSGEMIGGLVGANQGNVTRSGASGVVEAPQAAMVGGLAGDNPGSIYDSFAKGDVTGRYVAGGLVGSSAGQVQRSYSLGDVRAQSNAGALAGTLYAADTVVGAGQVTGEDYIGALAGSLSGKLVGAAGQVTVKNAYANCPGGLSVIGNTGQYQGEGNAAALNSIRLDAQEQVAEKLHALFGLGQQPTTPDSVDQTVLMDTIAQRLTDLPDGWVALDLALYSTLPGKTAQLSSAARQSALDSMIAEAASQRATASDRSRLELTLRAMGVDSTQLYGSGSSAKIDNAAALAQMDLTAGGYYAAPWVLLAQRQGNVALSEAQRESLFALLRENMGDGLFGYTWEGVSHSDPDTAGAVLAALAPYRESDPDAQIMVDTILAALAGGMDENGSYGSANSDAMVIIGLIALGRSPADWKAPSGASVVDGLLSYVNDAHTGFTYAGADNLLATEQGFRALVALAKFDGSALDIYDFSATSVTPGYATGSVQPSVPSRPSGPSGQGKLRVTLSLKTDTETWIDAQALELSPGSTVYHALTLALRENGLTAQGLEKGYVKSVTKGNVTLAEFDRGPNSGWLYRVNGVSPSLPLSAYVLKEGDDILWYYTADWSQGDSSGVGGSGDHNSIPSLPADPGKTFSDTAGHWAADSITFVTAQNLFQGVDGDHFDPDGVMSRAMLATVLFRLAGAPVSEGPAAFPDVPEDTWYTGAVVWASASGIVLGNAAGHFEPDAPITREQLVTMLYRYAGSTDADLSATAGLDGFADSAQVGEYARQAMAWAVSTGLIQGKSSGLLDPAGTATRAEVATVLERLVKLLEAS